jgi:hypothetical protein
VSKAHTLAKLQALLERVRARAAESRSPHANGPATANAMPAAPPPAAQPVELSTWSPPAIDATTRELEIEVEVDYVEPAQVSVAERSAGAEGPAPGTSESVERLVAAQPTVVSEGALDLAPPPPEDAGGEPRTTAAALEGEMDRSREDSAPPVETEAGGDQEEPEPVPASSRRQVMMTEPEERLEQMAFGSTETPPPRHTPPPESGRMPAAPAVELEGGATGLREVVQSAAEPPPSVVQLAPQPTRATLDSRDDIAEVLGQAEAFQPATFSALLDAAMAL